MRIGISFSTQTNGAGTRPRVESHSISLSLREDDIHVVQPDYNKALFLYSIENRNRGKNEALAFSETKVKLKLKRGCEDMCVC